MRCARSTGAGAALEVRRLGRRRAVPPTAKDQAPIPDGFTRWSGARVRAALTDPEHEPVPCHNDLLSANVLDDGQRVRILDWEYAGMGDRYFDLGNLAVNNGFTGADDEALLGAYWPDGCMPRRLAALRLMRVMSDFREGMWGVVQAAVSELDFDFAGYAASASAASPPRSRTPGTRPGSRPRVVDREVPSRARCVIVGGGVVQKRMSLIGDGIGHVAFAAGVGAGLVAGVAPLWTALGFAVAGAIGVEWLRSRRRASGDLALALFFYSGIALGVVLVSLGGGFDAGVLTYLFGQPLTVNGGEIGSILGLGAAIVAIVVVMRRLLFAVRRTDWSRVAGMPVDAANFALAALTACADVDEPHVDRQHPARRRDDGAAGASSELWRRSSPARCGRRSASGPAP